MIASAVIAATLSVGQGSASIVPTGYDAPVAHSVAVPVAEQAEVDPVDGTGDDVPLDTAVDDTADEESLALGDSEGSGSEGSSFGSVIGAPTPPPPPLPPPPSPQNIRQGNEKVGNLGRPGNVRSGNTVFGNLAKPNSPKAPSSSTRIGIMVGELLPGSVVVMSVFAVYTSSENCTAEKPEGNAVAVAVASVRLGAAAPVPVSDGPFDPVDGVPESEPGMINDAEVPEVTSVVGTEDNDVPGNCTLPVA